MRTVEEIADFCPETILYNPSGFVWVDPIVLKFPLYKVTIEYTIPDGAF